MLLWVAMDKESLATTHTPDDLFSRERWCRIVGSWRSGYIVEIQCSSLSTLTSRVERPNNNQICDIYRIDGLGLFADALKTSGVIESSWNEALPDRSGRRLFSVRLPSFKSSNARKAAAQRLSDMMASGTLALRKLPSMAGARLLTTTGAQDSDETYSPLLSNWASGAAETSNFVQKLMAAAETVEEIPSIPVGISSIDVLENLVASGVAVNWEAVQALRPVDAPEAEEDVSPLPPLDGAPVVGVIDGGYHGNRYLPAIAWRHDPLIPDAVAAKAHGDRITAIVVEGHIPTRSTAGEPLNCRVGVVQALPDRLAAVPWSTPRFLRYLDEVLAAHPDTHVWNLSANMERECAHDEVSDLAHGLSELMRRHNKLFVISAGNRPEDEPVRIAPPADCEPALVVSGRQHVAGLPGGPCPVSRVGLGPEGMLKPDTSWYSDFLAPNGTLMYGTSYAAALISRLAAHTWEHLTEPTPALVRALILNSCDLDKYCHQLGFGTPLQPQLPWVCSQNGVVIAWSWPMKAKERYYWRGIKVPPSLIKDGRFVGKAKLSVVLSPVVQRRGQNYVSTRVEATLRVPSSPRPARVVGSMDLKTRELTARRDDFKWQPVRCYSARFTETNGPKLTPDQTLEVYARVYWRNDFQYTDEYMDNCEMMVTFAIALEAEDSEADTYNEFSRLMRGEVDNLSLELEEELEQEQ